MSEVQSMPIRVQLRRTKGWRMPANTVSVARPGQWGNPVRVGGTIDNAQAVALFRRHWVPDDLSPLRGRNLACWCPLDQPCHADVLLELAKATPPQAQAPTTRLPLEG